MGSPYAWKSLMFEEMGKAAQFLETVADSTIKSEAYFLE